MAKSTAVHPFRDKMFLVVVRNHVANGLVSQLGYSRSEARQASHELADTLIEEAATKVSASDPAVMSAATPGGILAFLLAFLQSPLFGQLISLLLSLFGVAPAPAA